MKSTGTVENSLEYLGFLPKGFCFQQKAEARAGVRKTKPVHELVLDVDAIYPSPENAELYSPVLPDDEKTIELSNSIKVNGILEPIVITRDNFIVSGHRRHVAARIAGL